MIPIMVTGASGLLGSSILRNSPPNLKKIGLYNTEKVESIDTSFVKCDITDKENIKRIILKEKPEIIIHCAGLVSTKLCQENPQKAFLINDQGTKNIVDVFVSLPINPWIVYISSDYVFDGRKGSYKEKDLTCPLSVYGQSKLAGEKHISCIKNSIVIRTTFFGKNISSNKISFVEWIINELKNKRTITLFNDQFFTPVYSGHLAKLIFLLIQKKKRGLFHIGCDKRYSKFLFGLKVAEIFGLDTSFIKQESYKKSTGWEIKPQDVSLSNHWVKETLGLKEISLNEDLKMMKRRRG